MRKLVIGIGIAGFLLTSCGKTFRIENGNIAIEINDRLETKVENLASGVKPLMNTFQSSEYLEFLHINPDHFTLEQNRSFTITDQRGPGTRTILTAKFHDNSYALEKILAITVYDSFPDLASTSVQYINIGQRIFEVKGWINNAYRVNSAGDKPLFWSFQGSSTPERKDWILPIDSIFYQKNFMGMNTTDYGGGIPVIDLWRKDGGIAVGHLAVVPEEVSLPVEKDRYEECGKISVQKVFVDPLQLKPGDTLKTLETFVAVHQGDCFHTLREYSELMKKSGIAPAPVEPEAFEPVWCAWGYERKATQQEILGTLGKVKELGLKWVDIDDGYQQTEGDWDVNRSKYPQGGKDMRKMVDQIHAMGLKAKIWWAPLAINPRSELLKENPDMILLNKDEVPEFITYWNDYYMSPGNPKTIAHTKQMLNMFLSDWNYDGLKMDGGFLNCIPPDFSGRRRTSNPEEAPEKLPEFFKMIYETSRELKKDAVLQICPCGAAMSFFTMPWMNQAVASDPVSSWQTRLKCKTYKALLGPIAYYGDHVELSDGGDDFASQLGVGAVLGTKFTWPKDNPYAREGRFLLTPDKEKIWKKWISLYNQKMISRGNYLGDLYDIGYDKPETHVILKGDTLYYAFYAPSYNGKIELRGLIAPRNIVFDYVNNRDLGKVVKESPYIDATFKGSLLIEVIPE